MEAARYHRFWLCLWKEARLNRDKVYRDSFALPQALTDAQPDLAALERAKIWEEVAKAQRTRAAEMLAAS